MAKLVEVEVEVVGAVIVREGRVLCAQRGGDGALAAPPPKTSRTLCQ